MKLDAAITRFRRLEREKPGAGARLVRSALEPDYLRPAQRRTLNALRASPAAAKRAGIGPAGLKVYGHCKAAANVYWLLMGGKDSAGRPLVLKREKMRDGQLHFWVEEEQRGRIIDPTRAQLTRKLYPHHDYSKGKRNQIGSNQGKKVVHAGGRKYRLSAPTWAVLEATIAALPTTKPRRKSAPAPKKRPPPTKRRSRKKAPAQR